MAPAGQWVYSIITIQSSAKTSVWLASHGTNLLSAVFIPIHGDLSIPLFDKSSRTETPTAKARWVLN